MPNRRFDRLLLAATVLLITSPAMAVSFDCNKATTGSIEQLVCKTPALSAQDDKLAEVYKQARAKDEKPAILKAEQRGWLKGRDECWKAADKVQCVADAYQRRVAELQARYQLVPGEGPVRFSCDNPAGKELTATFYPTEPPTLIAAFGGDTSLMVAQAAAEASQYVGRNESFQERDGEARVVWGYGGREMKCARR